MFMQLRDVMCSYLSFLCKVHYEHDCVTCSFTTVGHSDARGELWRLAAIYIQG